MAERSTTWRTPSLRLTISRPEIQTPSLFSVLIGLLPFFRLQGSFVVIARLKPVAMVSLVVQRHYVLDAHQSGHYPLDHLTFGFHSFQRASGAPQQGSASTGNLKALAESQSVVVGDDYLGPLEVFLHVSRDQIPAGVVAVGVVGLEHPQPVFDGQAGGYYQETRE